MYILFWFLSFPFTTPNCLDRCTQISVTLLSRNCVTRITFAGMLWTSLVICSGIKKEVVLLQKISDAFYMFQRYQAEKLLWKSEYRKGKGIQRDRQNSHIISGGFSCVLGHKLGPESSSLSLWVCISIQQGVEVNSPALVLNWEPAVWTCLCLCCYSPACPNQYLIAKLSEETPTSQFKKYK